MDNQSPTDMIMSLVKRAKLQSANAALFFLGLLAMFFPWFKLDLPDELKGLADLISDEVDTSASYFQSADLLDILSLLVTLAALGAAAYVLFLEFNKKTSKKITLGATVIAAAAAGLNVVFAILHVLANNEEGVAVAWGFYFFMLVNLIALGLNGYKAYLNKTAVQELAQEVKTEAKEKMDSMSEEKKDMEAPAAKTAESVVSETESTN